MSGRLVSFGTAGWLLLAAPVFATDPGWEKLHSIILNDQMRIEARLSAVGLASESADGAQAQALLAIATGWLAELDQSGLNEADIRQDPLLRNRRLLLLALARQSGTNLNAAGNDPLAWLGLWANLAVRRWVDRETRDATLRLIAENPAPPAARRDAVLFVLEYGDLRGNSRVPQPLVNLLDNSAIPALRALVRQSADPDTFNFGAASILAQIGDAQIAGDLQSRRVAFRARAERFERPLVWFGWQIAVQNPPNRLLDHVRSAGLFSTPSRVWAVRRAAELGLPAGQIRQAILQYSTVGPPVGEARQPLGIGVLKSVGLEVGVLTATDLPNVQAVPAPASAAANSAGAGASANGEVGVSSFDTPALTWQRPAWEPRYENYPVLRAWLQTRPWVGLTSAQAIAMLRQRFCELDLSPPALCGATSQPAAPP